MKNCKFPWYHCGECPVFTFACNRGEPMPLCLEDFLIADAERAKREAEAEASIRPAGEAIVTTPEIDVMMAILGDQEKVFNELMLEFDRIADMARNLGVELEARIKRSSQ